jgi:hypothetical protein
MKDIYYLRDTRSNTGSCAMFWKNGGGYTSDLLKAQEFSREAALGQCRCRNTDLPVCKATAVSISYPAVDMQYVDIQDRGVQVEHPNVTVIKGLFDGNNLAYLAADGSFTFDLSKAQLNAPRSSERNRVQVSAKYISSHARIVVNSNRLWEAMEHDKPNKASEFYSCKLGAEEQGLEVVIHRWVAFRETDKVAWCIRRHRRHTSIDPGVPDLPLKAQLAWAAERHYTVKKINKENSRIAFPTPERALSNLVMLKKRQQVHLERSKLFNQVFLDHCENTKLREVHVVEGSYLIPGTSHLVSSSLRFY